MIRMGLVEFPTNRAKANWMLTKSAEDVKLPEVQRWSQVFRNLPERERPAAILKFCQFGLQYVRDPRREVLEDSAVTLVRGWGDCDAKSRLFVALCRACGIPARGLPVRPDDDFPHILAEVFINGQWTPADPTVLNSSIGRIPSPSMCVTNYW